MPQDITLYQTPLPVAAEQRGTTAESWHILSTVLYKGASDEMICTILDYCKARRLDPLKKPFHIVQVWDSDLKRKVESIWPSIGETRITAMRTGQYAGMAEMQHGPTVKKRIGNTEMEFPEWAQCTVYRMVGGQRCEFSGPRVYWLETYAQAGRDPDPNYMWKRRPFGQLDKCAEAAALRCAFPEEAFMQTAEEMEDQAVHLGPDRAREINPGPTSAKQINDLDSLVDYHETQTTNGQPAPDILHTMRTGEHDPETGELPPDYPLSSLGGLADEPLPPVHIESAKELLAAIEDCPDTTRLAELDINMQAIAVAFSESTRTRMQNAMTAATRRLFGGAST